MCTDCAAGKYGKAVVSASDVTGQDNADDCTDCVAGKFLGTAGAASDTCANCGAGKYTAAGASVCTDCAAGKICKDIVSLPRSWDIPAHCHARARSGSQADRGRNQGVPPGGTPVRIPLPRGLQLVEIRRFVRALPCRMDNKWQCGRTRYVAGLQCTVL